MQKGNLGNLAFLVVVLFLTGCAVEPVKFNIEPGTIGPLKGDGPIQIVGTKSDDSVNAVHYVERGEIQDPEGPVFEIDFNEVNNDAVELLRDELITHGIPVTKDAKKSLKFTTLKAEWYTCGGGFLYGANLYFEIDTGDGYKREYKVSDRSPFMNRVFGGTITKAAEKVLTDERILEYLRK